MKNDNKIMEISLPNPEAADLTVKAAQHGIPTAEYLGIQAIAGAYGQMHPKVIDFRNRAKNGINGPKTPDAEVEGVEPQ
jgi:hypothetical protein